MECTPPPSPANESLDLLLQEIRACRVCEADLPLGPRPVLAAHERARVLIVGQAPGTAVNASGVPWDDPSGRRLRQWMGVDEATFYDASRIAIVPMGFCYPGRGKGGDLPPRHECAPLWMERVLRCLPHRRLTILAGQHAIRHHLGARAERTLTETVRAWRRFAPGTLPMPHPSPRNNIWLRRNAWFEREVVPALQRRCKALLGL